MSMSLDSILVPSVISVSVPLHEHAYISPLFLLWYVSALFTNKLWESCKIFDFLLLYQVVFVSVFELQEHASSHYSLLWYREGIVYQQINGKH